jgi:hypothetical protein
LAEVGEGAEDLALNAGDGFRRGVASPVGNQDLAYDSAGGRALGCCRPSRLWRAWRLCVVRGGRIGAGWAV